MNYFIGTFYLVTFWVVVNSRVPSQPEFQLNFVTSQVNMEHENCVGKCYWVCLSSKHLH